MQPSHMTIAMSQSGNTGTWNVSMAGITAATVIHVNCPLHNQHPHVVKVLKTTMDWMPWLVMEQGPNLPDLYLSNVIKWVISQYHTDVSFGNVMITISIHHTNSISDIMEQESVEAGKIIHEGTFVIIKDDMATTQALLIQWLTDDDHAKGQANLYQFLDTNFDSDDSNLVWNAKHTSNLLQPAADMAGGMWYEGLVSHLINKHRFCTRRYAQGHGTNERLS